MGISETVIHFVIYEAVKKRLQEWSHSSRTLADEDYNSENKTSSDFIQFMAAGAFSKTVASCIAYPHGMWLWVWDHIYYDAKMNYS
jgi:solute carrier family 25 protein 33/36